MILYLVWILYGLVYTSQTNSVADHCRNFALSDPNTAEFQAPCRDHNHDLVCSKRERLSEQVRNLRVLPFDST